MNDTTGHQAGDAAARGDCEPGCIRACGEGDILGRMGGDEFAVLVRNVQSAEDAATVADQVLEQVSIPFYIGGSKLVMGASIGVSIYPDNATDAEELLKSADAAMYRAKELGRNNCQFSLRNSSQANLARADMERDLRLAMERDELEVYYQPIVEVRTMRIAGAEALLRWDQPEKGIDLAQSVCACRRGDRPDTANGQNGAGNRLQAVQELAVDGLPDFEMSVNVSPMQLSDIGFVSEVDESIAQAGLPPQQPQARGHRNCACQRRQRRRGPSEVSEYLGCEDLHSTISESATHR